MQCNALQPRAPFHSLLLMFPAEERANSTDSIPLPVNSTGESDHRPVMALWVTLQGVRSGYLHSARVEGPSGGTYFIVLTTTTSRAMQIMMGIHFRTVVKWNIYIYA